VKGGDLPDAVALFPTCLGDLITPETVEHAQGALEACGIEVRAVRRATCCGQPAFNAGYPSQARRVARATLRALAQTTGPIVVPAGSCAAMMSRHWVGLFAGDRDADLARQIAARVVEFSAILADRIAVLEDLELQWEGRAAYHDSCHMLRELGLRASRARSSRPCAAWSWSRSRAPIAVADSGDVFGAVSRSLGGDGRQQAR